MGMLQSAIAYLRDQHDKIEAAILALERCEQIEHSQSQLKEVPHANRGGKASPPPVAPRKAKPVARQASTGVEKECKVCHVIKPMTEFEPHKMCRDGRIGTCRECRREKKQPRTGDPIPAEIDKVAASTAVISGKHRCEECHCTFMGPAQLREHIRERHTV